MDNLTNDYLNWLESELDEKIWHEERIGGPGMLARTFVIRGRRDDIRRELARRKAEQGSANREAGQPEQNVESKLDPDINITVK